MQLRAFRNVFQTYFARSLTQLFGQQQFASSCPGAIGYGAWVTVVTSLRLSKVAELQTRTASKKVRSASLSTYFVTARPHTFTLNLDSDYFALLENERKVYFLRVVMVYRRGRSTDPLILNSVLYDGWRLTSRPGRFTPGLNHGTHRTGSRFQ